MAIRRHTKLEEPEINMTPMLDIVFIMLIFFIVTASFVKEPGIDVDKPETTQAALKPRANVIIAIAPNNKIWVENREVDVEAVLPYIERIKAENPEGEIVIQADSKSHARLITEVMQAAAAAGFKTVSVAGEQN